MGIGSAASAIGGHQSAQAQAAAQNRAAIANYKHQLQMRELDWSNARNKYSARLSEFDEGVFLDRERVWNAYEQNQEALNQKATETAFANEKNAVALAKAMGKSGTGQDNRGTAAMDALKEFGRTQAQMKQKMIDASYAMETRNRGAQQDAQDSMNRRHGPVSVAIQPGIAPPRPEMAKGPSGLALAGQLIGAAATAYGGIQAAQSPKAYGFENMMNRDALTIDYGSGSGMPFMNSTQWNPISTMPDTMNWGVF